MLFEVQFRQDALPVVCLLFCNIYYIYMRAPKPATLHSAHFFQCLRHRFRVVIVKECAFLDNGWNICIVRGVFLSCYCTST